MKLAAAALCCLQAACSHGEATLPPASTPHYVERAQSTSARHLSEGFRLRMSEHFGYTVWARDATTLGDLVAARDALTLLANRSYDQVVPGAWLPRVRALQDDAGNTARATNIEAVARGVARIGRGCGECHAATGGGPAISGIPTEQTPLAPDSFPDRMFRHGRAISALWWGLIAPSDTVWNQAASNLSNVSAETARDAQVPEDFRTALQGLQQLAARARLAGTQRERADTYGEILSACADCHQRKWPAIF